MTKRRSLLVLAVLLTIYSAPSSGQRSYPVDILAETFAYDESTRASIPVRELQQGCPARDCIPSIDKPWFVAAADATHVADDDVVVALSMAGAHRAYPTRILDRHEIVNDVIAGTAVAITYCPLCGSAVGVLRNLNGVVTEFGVSGLLYNSDLVFYDRETNTLWDQIEAKGIVGPLTGESLTLVPVTMTRWSRWRNAHPDTLVLSTNTGFAINYSEDAYADYRNTDELMFPVSNSSDRIRPKAVVFGFDVDGTSVAYTEDLLQKRTHYTHEINGETVTVSLHDDGSVDMEVIETGARYTPVRLFWFAWYTFHPKTTLNR